MTLGIEKSKDSARQEVPSKKRQKGIRVSKVEISDNKVKFYIAKGLIRKKWIAVTEIPVLEIERIEKFGNELNVTWKGIDNAFSAKGKTDLFSKLIDQVNTILTENNANQQQQKSEETRAQEEKEALRKTELLALINSSVGVIDQFFNVLIGLQDKRINWQRIEGYSKKFGENQSFTGKTIPPLNLDFTKIASAIKSQIPKETSKEAYTLLETTYNYFNGLNLDDDHKENHPNLHDAKSVILSYFMLNDLLLGKVVGDKENNEEISELESTIENLPAGANFKVDIELVKNAINRLDVTNKREIVVGNSREIFKKQLKQEFKPSQPLTITPLVPQTEISAMMLPENKPVVEPAEPVIKEAVVKEVVAEPAVKEEAIPEPIIKEEPVAEALSKVETNAEPSSNKEAIIEPVSTENVPEPVPKEETVPEPVTKKEAIAEPVTKSEIVNEPISNEEIATEPVSKAEPMAGSVSKVEVSTEPAPETKKMQERILVSKVEVSDNTAKFFVAKGFIRKQWVVVKEIPLVEIERIEKFANEVSVTWKGAVLAFFSKEKADIFRLLVDRVNALLEGATSEPPIASTENAEAAAKSEASVEPEPVPKEEAGLNPVSENAVAKPMEPSEPAMEQDKSVSKVELSAIASESVPKEEVASEPASNVEVMATAEPVSTVEVTAESVSKVEVSTEPVSKGEKMQERILVSKVEVSDNTAKFFVAKGFIRKQWVVVKEIPLVEIEGIEKFANEVNVTWKSTVYTFFSKEKADIFRPLVDRFNAMLEGVTSEPPAVSIDNAESPAKSEVTTESITKEDVGTDSVAKDAVAEPTESTETAKPAEPIIENIEPVSKGEPTAETSTNSQGTESDTSPPAENQPATEAPRRRLRRGRNKVTTPDSSSKAQS